MGTSLLKENEYELGIILILLGIVLLVLAAYFETLSKQKLAKRLATLERYPIPEEK